MLFNIFVGTAIHLFYRIFLPIECTKQLHSLEIEIIYLFTYFTSDIKNYKLLLNNLMDPFYTHLYLLIGKKMFILNTIYQYLVLFILTIIYYLGPGVKY